MHLLPRKQGPENISLFIDSTKVSQTAKCHILRSRPPARHHHQPTAFDRIQLGQKRKADSHPAFDSRLKPDTERQRTTQRRESSDDPRGFRTGQGAAVHEACLLPCTTRLGRNIIQANSSPPRAGGDGISVVEDKRRAPTKSIRRPLEILCKTSTPCRLDHASSSTSQGDRPTASAYAASKHTSSHSYSDLQCWSTAVRRSCAFASALPELLSTPERSPTTS